MLENDCKKLSDYRLAKAKDCLVDAKSLLELGRYANCANRSYYAMFHSVRAVLALDGLDFKKHSAVIGKFRELYIKPGLIGIVYSDIIGNAFDVRGKSDYDDFYLLDKAEIEQQLANAEQFVNTISKYLEQKVAK